MKKENEDDLLTKELTGVDIIYKEISPTTRTVVILDWSKRISMQYRLQSVILLETPSKDIHYYYTLGLF